MEEFNMTVENKLVAEKRDMSIYHHTGRSTHIISYNSSITLPLRTIEKDDYLHISPVSGPGNLWRDCLIDIPSWADFTFSSEGKITFTHSGDRMILKIPPGPPSWQLRITRPTGPPAAPLQPPAHVTIS